MWLHHDLGWWGFVLAVATLILAYPLDVLAHLSTPLVRNWIASRGKNSLVKRIALLEGELAELEKEPAISEAENQILWAIQSVKMELVVAMNLLMGVVYFGVRSLSEPLASQLEDLRIACLGILVVNFIWQMSLRYHHGFRYRHSPAVRKGLKKAIDDLKAIRDSWE